MAVVVNVGCEQERPPGHGDQGQNGERLDGLAKREPRENCCNARCQRKEGAGMHDTQLAQAANEEHDRQPVGHRTHEEHAREPGDTPMSELPQ